MNAMQIVERCEALNREVQSATSVEEVTTLLAAMRRVYNDQCLECYHSGDDPIHQPRAGRFRTRSPECAYLPRLPSGELEPTENGGSS